MCAYWIMHTVNSLITPKIQLKLKKKIDVREEKRWWWVADEVEGVSFACCLLLSLLVSHSPPIGAGKVSMREAEFQVLSHRLGFG